MPVNIDRRPRRFVPLVLAVIAIARTHGPVDREHPRSRRPPCRCGRDAAPTPGHAAVVPDALGQETEAQTFAADPMLPSRPTPTPTPDPRRRGASCTVASPRRSGAPSRSRTPVVDIPRDGVPIVYYHRVESIPPEFRYWGPIAERTFLAYDSLPTAFEAQLDWLQANGYTTILPRDLAAHWDTGARLPTGR